MDVFWRLGTRDSGMEGVGFPLMAVGFRLMASGSRLSAFGCWLLAVGCWLSDFGDSGLEDREWRIETREQGVGIGDSELVN